MRKRTYGPYAPQSYRVAKKSKQVAKRKATSFRVPVKSASFIPPSPATPLKAFQYTTFIYADTGFSIDPGVGGSTGVRVLSLNSLYDPDVTGTGHQPAGFDQLMAIYEEYCVYAVKYKCSWYNSDGSNEMIGGVTITDQLSTSTDPRVYIENGMTQWALSSNKGASTGERIREHSGYVDLAKVHGIDKKSMLSENSYRGNVGSSPNEQAYLHLWVAPANATSDLATSVWCVELTYYVVLQGGKLNALS